MNQQSKKLLFNKSTLLSLKAELLKKQEEVKGKKQLPQHSAEHHKQPAAVRASHDQPPSFKDKLNKEVDTDELEAHKRSKSALEKKAELYAHLSEGAGASQLSGRFLVDFANKRYDEPPPPAPPPPDLPASEPEADYDDDDEWTDFTDCLGRTRRCLKTDLQAYRRRDEQLVRTMKLPSDARDEDDAAEASARETEPPKEVAPQPSEKPLLVQQTDAYLQSLRDKWEKKEKELTEQDRDIHYQDLLFDEARAHGVGYYGFSTEEAARRREQAELARAREETCRAQAQAAARRAERDELVAARVAAARASRRLRAGLPPEDPEQKKEDFTASLLDFLTEKKKEAAEKAKEEEKRARDEREVERQKLRETFVREWDVGKEGERERAGFREMTQEEYEEQQRAKRVEEFAPPRADYRDRARNTFDDRGHFVGNGELPVVNRSWAEVRPVPTTSEFIDVPLTTQGLYFSTAAEAEHNRSSGPSRVANAPVPIVNELEAEPEERPRRVFRNANPGAEIEPPPTFEYYGTEAKRSRPDGREGGDAREAYEQGLKYLQSMESKRTMPKNFDFIM